MKRMAIGLICAFGLVSEAAADRWLFEAPEPGRRAYVEMHLGTNLPAPVDVRMTNSIGARFTGDIDMRSKLGGVLALVHGYYPTRRIHLETSVAYGQFTNFTMRFKNGFAGNPDAGRKRDGTGQIHMFAATAAAFYDFPEVSETIVPFVGLGGGFAHMKQDGVGKKGGRFLISDSDTFGVLCLMAGVNITMTEKVDLSLRYSGIFRSEAEFNDRNAAASFRSEMQAGFDNAVSVGFRYFYR